MSKRISAGLLPATAWVTVTAGANLSVINAVRPVRMPISGKKVSASSVFMPVKN
jgi:hypothetical protein